MQTFSWDTRQESIPGVISFAVAALKAYKCESKESKRVMLLTEEILTFMVQENLLESDVKFEVKKTFSGVMLVIKAKERKSIYSARFQDSVIPLIRLKMMKQPVTPFVPCC